MGETIKAEIFGKALGHGYTFTKFSVVVYSKKYICMHVEWNDPILDCLIKY